MKTVNSGIYRRMDDLGRVVIPKEMRKMVNIKEGDFFEIGVANGCLILETYTGEIDEETGKPKPQVNEGTPVQAVKKEPTTLYIDTYEPKAYADIKDIALIMAENDDIQSFDSWLNDDWTANKIVDTIENKYNGDCLAFLQELRKDYEDFAIGEAQTLINNDRYNHYISITI